ncbi:excinuclease ABC subunit UvrC [Candidatus Saccharibacteria bacterium]|nr:excinuclease ABC subunit UvrC [Candidatus Saccharibacteria bacterium]
MNKQLEAKLKDLPSRPGVYFHKSASGEVLYVGKAAVLRNRVRQYFQSKKDMDIKTQALVAEVEDTDWIETESEIDALFLESEMVKRYKPRFNVLLRDDKSQLYVRIDMKSEWPVVSFTRNPADDGAEYYGPYYNGYAVKKALRYLRRVFPHYVKAPRVGVRPSLDAHMGLDPHGMTSIEYKGELKKLISYIKGNRVQLVRELEHEMKRAAEKQEFEQAARLRNRIRNLSELQRRIMFGDREFLDISKDKALRDIAEIFNLPKLPSRIECYDVSHMGGANVVASMVVFTNGVSDRSAYRKFKTAEKNDDAGNMKETLLRRLSEKNIKSWGSPDLLIVDGGIPQLGAAIEAQAERGTSFPVISIAKREEEIIVSKVGSHIDVSKLMSNENYTVHSKNNYLTVNLHPGRVKSAGHSANLRGVSSRSTYDDIVKLFQRIRDESHRFAVSYHTVLKRKNQTASSLEQVPGIGPATRRKLIRTFGSLRGVQSATYEQLVEVVGESKARNIKTTL